MNINIVIGRNSNEFTQKTVLTHSHTPVAHCRRCFGIKIQNLFCVTFAKLMGRWMHSKTNIQRFTEYVTLYTISPVEFPCARNVNIIIITVTVLNYVRFVAVKTLVNNVALTIFPITSTQFVCATYRLCAKRFSVYYWRHNFVSTVLLLHIALSKCPLTFKYVCVCVCDNTHVRFDRRRRRRLKHELRVIETYDIRAIYTSDCSTKLS